MTCLKAYPAIFIGFSLLLVTTGCIDPYKIFNSEFQQVTKQSPSHQAIATYLNTMTLYDGFETAAHFDVLWMSDAMRTVYAELHSAKIGFNKQQADAFWTHQLAENDRTMTFYVLCQINDESHIGLSDKNSAWSLYLEAPQHKRIQPLSVREVEIEPEIKCIFGYRYARFKKMYQVSFSAVDLHGILYVKPGDQLRLVLAGAGMRGESIWTMPSHTSRATLQKELALKTEEKGRLFSFMSDIAAQNSYTDDIYF